MCVCVPRAFTHCQQSALCLVSSRVETSSTTTHDILEAEILPKSRINCVVMVTCLMVPSINSTGVDNGPQKFGFCLTPSRECTRGVAAKETHTSRKGNRICRVRYLVPIVLFLILYVYISCLSHSLSVTVSRIFVSIFSVVVRSLVCVLCQNGKDYFCIENKRPLRSFLVETEIHLTPSLFAIHRVRWQWARCHLRGRQDNTHHTHSR